MSVSNHRECTDLCDRIVAGEQVCQHVLRLRWFAAIDPEVFLPDSELFLDRDLLDQWNEQPGECDVDFLLEGLQCIGLFSGRAL